MEIFCRSGFRDLTHKLRKWSFGCLFCLLFVMGLSRPLFLYFRLFYSIQLTDKFLTMLGFELLSSCAGSNRLANCATASAQFTLLVCWFWRNLSKRKNIICRFFCENWESTRKKICWAAWQRKKCLTFSEQTLKSLSPLLFCPMYFLHLGQVCFCSKHPSVNKVIGLIGKDLSRT